MIDVADVIRARTLAEVERVTRAHVNFGNEQLLNIIDASRKQLKWLWGGERPHGPLECDVALMVDLQILARRHGAS